MKTRIDDFTMVIPTHDRPRMLATALRHYTTQDFDFQIFVVDSSKDEAQERNATAIRSCEARIVHARYPASTPISEKWHCLPDYIKTPFAMYAADDDVALLPGVLGSLQFLRNHPEYVACHGTYYNAAVLESGEFRVGIECATHSIELYAPVERLFALALRYEAITCAVQRRETFIAARPPLDVESGHFWELFNAFAIVISGKVAALLTPYMVRNAQLGYQPDFLGDGNNWLMRESDVMGRAYLRFRDRLEPLLAPHARKRSARHLTDIIYTTFIARQFNYRVIANILETDGDIGLGVAKSLFEVAARGNAAPMPTDAVLQVLREFMLGGWPFFE